MTATASVVVVSRDRPALLCRCLRGALLQDHPAYEIVVVADPPGLGALAAAGLDQPIKTVPFDQPNIAAARNLGIAAAAGDHVAFLDDDAVPEPTWLARLTAALDVAEAAGGFVRGRNGISYQWRARRVDRRALEDEIPDWGDAMRVFPPPPDSAVKLQGTNMAFRRETLARLGGFDPAYRFYLDETDLCLRLAAAGATVAVVPGAEVQHAYAASPRRGADRAPHSLHEIGASLAVFLRRHAPEDERPVALELARDAERRRIDHHLAAGRIGPREVTGLLAGFEAGLAEGSARPLGPLPALPARADTPFRSAATGPHPRWVLAGRPWQARRLRAEAARAAADGTVVTLVLLGPTARPHRMEFTPGGWWELRGGLFGRSERTGPHLRLSGFETRVRQEFSRLARVRGRDPEPPGSRCR